MIKSLFAILVTASYAAQPYPTSFKVFKNSTYVDVQVKTHSGLHFSENCFKNKNVACDAYEATKTPAATTPSKIGTVGHPASRYCNDKGGAARILITANNRQYDFCQFKDGSMVDSWDLYNKFNKNPATK